MRIFTKFLIAFSGIIFFAACVYSQDFEVSPVSIRFKVEPGDSQKRVVNITNHSNKKASFSFEIKDYYYATDGTEKKFPPNSIKRSCSDWININPSFIEINPNELYEVDVTIVVPANEYSTRWSKIYVKSVREQTSFDVDKSLGTGIGVSGAIAIDVTQSPESNRNFRANISNFTQKGKEDSVMVFSAFINNTGDKIVKCKVYLIASSIQTAEEIKYDPVTLRVYPESSREIKLKLPLDLPPGKYSVAVVLDYGHNNLEAAQVIIDIP